MIRVLVVDDSALMRRVLADALSLARDIVVVGTAADAYEARDQIAVLRPDVLTLDVEMPRMDGLTFLEKLMAAHPVPVVVVSSVTPASSARALRALALGAVGVVSKPSSALASSGLGRDLALQVRAAALAKVRNYSDFPSWRLAPAESSALVGGVVPKRRILAIGASTGGPRAVEGLLKQLPAGGPATVIVQHMPAPFTDEFARRLDCLCAMRVAQATDGEELLAGTALIAPGGRHLIVHRVGDAYVVRLRDMPAVNHHRPSVDVMMHSVARAAGADAVGVILTGMGNDGAKGLLAMREAGAHTIAQDEETSIVYGMPREAAEVGGATQVLPVERIASAARAAASSR